MTKSLVNIPIGKCVLRVTTEMDLFLHSKSFASCFVEEFDGTVNSIIKTISRMAYVRQRKQLFVKLKNLLLARHVVLRKTNSHVTLTDFLFQFLYCRLWPSTVSSWRELFSSRTWLRPAPSAPYKPLRCRCVQTFVPTDSYENGKLKRNFATQD